MTRDEIMTEYEVDDHGIIHSPGKFEAEMLYAPHFSEFASSDGEDLSYMEDGCGEFAALIEVDDDDRREFPELGTAKYVLIIESDQGFVSVETIETEDDADKIRADYAPDDDGDDDEDEHRIGCDQCELLRINGIVSHEQGCPNDGARYDSESGEWVKQRKCFDCGCTVDHDDPCCSQPYND